MAKEKEYDIFTAGIKLRIGLAAGVMKCHCLDRVWHQTNLSLSTKIRIYSTCVLAVLLYGSENWTLTQPDWKRLDSFHTRCQRQILHIRSYDHITNDEVLRRTGLLSPHGLIYRPQTKAWTVRSRCQICR